MLPWALALSVLFFSWSGFAQASNPSVDHDARMTALNEPNPTGRVSLDEPLEFDVLSVDGDMPRGWKIEVIKDSLQWSRVDNILMFARVSVQVKREAGGEFLLQHRGVISRSANRRANILVAPGSASGGAIDILIENESVFRFVVVPKRSHVIFDFTCSPFNVRLVESNLPEHSLVFLSCQRLIGQGESGARPFLRLKTAWSTWQEEDVRDYQLTSDSNQILLSSPRQSAQIKIAYATGPRFYKVQIGGGVGPYTYDLSAPDVQVKTKTALATLYGSFYLDEAARFVSFIAVPLHRKYYWDAGLYLNYESFRMLDRRISFNLLIGAHVLSFPFRNERRMSPGYPQGVELVAFDLFGNNWNTNLGAFYYPEINQQAYKNIWLRLGRQGYFGELNYLHWKELIGASPTEAKNIGLSFGMPLARLF